MDGNGNPNYENSKFVVDWFERILWTGAQAALAAVSFSEFDLPLWSLPIIAAGLAAVKGFVAKMVGNSDSASTVPSV